MHVGSMKRVGRQGIRGKRVGLAIPIMAVGVTAFALFAGGSSASAVAANGRATKLSLESSSKAAAHFASFTGGKAGARPSGAAITIGLINDTGGVPSFPDSSGAALVAAKVVNQELGGAGGHPIKIDTCYPTTEAQGQACAQQFLADSHMSIIIDGVTPVGAASFLSTINGKIPVIEATPAIPNEAAATNAYAIASGGFAANNDATYMAKDLKAKTVGVIGASDDPGSVAAVGQLKTTLQSLGVSVSVATYLTTSSDLVPAMSSVDSADVIYADAVSVPNCIAAAQAAIQLKITKPVVGINECVTTAVLTALGDFPRWTTRWNYEDPYAAATPDVAAYDTMMHKYGDSVVAGAAGTSFSAVLLATRVINEIGAKKLTPKAASAKLAKFKGPAPLCPPNLKFGSIKGEPALGTIASRMYGYKGNGVWTDASHGWISAG
jgi:hypothetical protein